MDATFQEIDRAKIFELVGCEIIPWQTKVFIVRAGVFALMSDVVDRKHAGNIREGATDLEIGGRQRRLPIMRMDDIRCKAGIATQLQRRSSKEAEAPPVVPVVVEFAIVIEPGAAEILVELEKTKTDSREVDFKAAAPL